MPNNTLSGLGIQPNNPCSAVMFAITNPKRQQTNLFKSTKQHIVNVTTWQVPTLKMHTRIVNNVKILFLFVSYFGASYSTYIFPPGQFLYAREIFLTSGNSSVIFLNTKYYFVYHRRSYF